MMQTAQMGTSRTGAHGVRTASRAATALSHRSIKVRSSARENLSQQAPDLSEQSLNAAALPRRQILAMGCSCCFSLVAGMSISPAAANEGYTFSYGEEAGPLSWGGTCITGMQQSPINLPRIAAAATASCSTTLQPEFQYRTNNTVRVKNTGTTIQVNFEPGNIVSWGQQQLELLQYHFHTPSEHAWDGQRTAMEAHLVHRNRATGSFVVLGIMLQPPSTAAQQRPNPCLAAALQHVPQQPQTEASCPTLVNPMQLVPSGPAARQFVHYTGSLTTPPCSESVDWLVWEQPLSITDQQALEFMLFAGSRKTYGHNARPLQPMNGRSLDYNCLAVA